ncbi:MAG: nucleotidyltransferase domain-containing protein [Desulfobacula sp.]|uniref:nucleotidyltransferase domain-containing protein n=1 Tax=Desulfobacula sp. TaxID=2593537 RepID=UPI0025BFA787|nr:nucleotidyltransferase domain-containing protein [Desulfobacula sp.]MCD4722843.1 nucleotidyltransferase domain-containing protein [Desulfobacula sp.]
MSGKEIDLPAKTIIQMVSIFSTYPEVEKVVVFGSRVLGNAKPGSDVDCAISGKNVTSQLVSRIQNYLKEETLLPYFFDCLCFESIQNQDLCKHINTYGKVLYEKK